MSETNTYGYKLHCHNCKATNEFQIPQGTTVHEWREKEARTLMCGNCKCFGYLSEVKLDD